MTNDGVEVKWLPLTDEYGIPIVPPGRTTFHADGFRHRGLCDRVGLPRGLGASGDDWWLPPTDWGLAYTNWTCEHWYMEFGWGDSDPDYSGTAQLYYRNEEIQEYELAYFGVWRMEG